MPLFWPDCGMRQDGQSDTSGHWIFGNAGSWYDVSPLASACSMISRTFTWTSRKQYPRLGSNPWFVTIHRGFTSFVQMSQTRHFKHVYQKTKDLITQLPQDSALEEYQFVYKPDFKIYFCKECWDSPRCVSAKSTIQHPSTSQHVAPQGEIEFHQNAFGRAIKTEQKAKVGMTCWQINLLWQSEWRGGVVKITS